MACPAKLEGYKGKGHKRNTHQTMFEVIMKNSKAEQQKIQSRYADQIGDLVTQCADLPSNEDNRKGSGADSQTAAKILGPNLVVLRGTTDVMRQA